MQIKKEILLFCLLIVFSTGLFIAANLSAKDIPCSTIEGKTPSCCQEQIKSRPESPWNFITNGILHLSV